MKESVLIVIGNGIVGSERSVESPDCLLLSVILKLLLPSKMYFGKKKNKIVCIGSLFASPQTWYRERGMHSTFLCTSPSPSTHVRQGQLESKSR